MINPSKLLIGEKTDQGLVRDNNEDSYLVVDGCNTTFDLHRHSVLLAVADGMGGHAAGETASRMACDVIADHYYDAGSSEAPAASLPEAVGRRLANAVHAANQAVFEFSQEHNHCEGMGTTLSALVLIGSHVVIAHVGDSRIYRLRQSNLTQLTVDHTEVQALVEMGRLRPEKAATHPRRHVLMQAIGANSALEEIFTHIEPLEAEDLFLLCSDGLHDMINDNEIRQILIDTPAPQAACDKLVAAALSKGGKDNVSVVLARVSKTGETSCLRHK